MVKYQIELGNTSGMSTEDYDYIEKLTINGKTTTLTDRYLVYTGAHWRLDYSANPTVVVHRYPQDIKTEVKKIEEAFK